MNCKVIKIEKQLSFVEAAMLQHQMFALVNAGKFDGVLLVLEHRPVMTTGVDFDAANLFVSEEELKNQGIEISKTDRTGGITYNGPGQIVVYPVLKLEKFNIKSEDYTGKLETVMNNTISKYNLTPSQVDGYPGVFVNNIRTCFIGIKERKGVGYQGLSLDVTTDMANYKLINPSGMTDYKVGKLQDFVKDIKIEDVKDQIIKSFNKIFGVVFEISNMKDMMPAGGMGRPGGGAKRPASAGGGHPAGVSKRPAHTGMGHPAGVPKRPESAGMGHPHGVSKKPESAVTGHPHGVSKKPQ